MRDLKVQLNVDMTCEACVKAVSSVLDDIPGVKKYDVDLANKMVVVEGSVAPSKVCNALKQTGRTVIIRGQGSAYTENIGAAVCIFEEQVPAGMQRKPKGLARLVQVDPELCLIDVTVEGLNPGPHALSVNELGDFTEGCRSTGDCFDKPSSSSSNSSSSRTTTTTRKSGVSHEDSDDHCSNDPLTTTAPGDPLHRHAGDVGTIMVDAKGRGNLFTETDRFNVYDVIGRSMVIAELKKTKQQGQDTTVWQKGVGLLGGIIARSAGLFENSKVVCACSGKTLWEEAKANASL